MIAAIAAGMLLAGCGGKSSTEEQLSASASAEMSSSKPAPAFIPSTAAPATNCIQAPPVLVEAINAAFTGGETIDNAQAVNAPSDMTYIGGNILSGTEVISNRDVWLAQNGAIYALSSDARRRTTLPDGRDIASAGDEYGGAVIDCLAR